MKKPILAIIVPSYNEEEVLSTTIEKLSEILKILFKDGKVSNQSYICFIDDGSSDSTWQIIQNNSSSNKHLKGIKLSRNFGHQNALLAGLKTCKADIFISIDADLQDDVNAIVTMVDHYLNGSEIVYGIRKSRAVDSFFKRFTALTFYKFMAFMGVKSIYNHADYRLMSMKVVEKFNEFGEFNLFIRAIIPLIGFKSSNVYYDRKERFAGESKYPFKKMLSFAWDGITSFSTFPLKIITIMGTLTFCFSIIIGLYSLYQKIIGNVVPGWTSTVLPIYFLGGIQLLGVGILGEYIGKIYKEVKSRPRFTIEKEI